MFTIGVVCVETFTESILVGELRVLVKACLSSKVYCFIDLASVDGMRREWLFAVDMMFALDPELAGLNID